MSNNKATLEVIEEEEKAPSTTTEPQETEEQRKFLDMKVSCHRHIVMPDMTMREVLERHWELDSDITYRDGDKIVFIVKNRKNLITNSKFETNDDILSENGNANPESAVRINKFLRRWGKIPEFIEIRHTPEKGGYGAFALIDIPKHTPLAPYLGINRTPTDPNNRYYHMLFDDSKKSTKLSVDAENIMFSNWTRFINDGKTHNCAYNRQIYQIWVIAIEDIKKGDELTVDYGEQYWKNPTYGQKSD